MVLNVFRRLTDYVLIITIHTYWCKVKSRIVDTADTTKLGSSWLTKNRRNVKTVILISRTRWARYGPTSVHENKMIPGDLRFATWELAGQEGSHIVSACRGDRLACVTEGLL